jgi:hypothetical protein
MNGCHANDDDDDMKLLVVLLSQPYRRMKFAVNCTAPDLNRKACQTIVSLALRAFAFGFHEL